jgi:hypothetical protein
MLGLLADLKLIVENRRDVAASEAAHSRLRTRPIARRSMSLDHRTPLR